MKVLKEQIVNNLYELNTQRYEAEEYFAEIRYERKTTEVFINFLKESNNTNLIKEIAFVKSYKIMKKKYNFPPEFEQLYCTLKETPSLYVDPLRKKHK